MESEEMMKRCFRRAGKKYGYTDVNAEFVSFKDFKVRWQRSYRWADFKVSDYLEDAPEGVFDSLAESLFGRICGENTGYSQELKSWVTRPGFVRDKQMIYVRRCRTILRTPAGDSRDLNESYRRLCDAGLLEYDPEIYLTWARAIDDDPVGHCSVLMKFVSISKILDSENVPEYVLDYCLYHELCHILLGFDPEGKMHSKKYSEIESRYPMMADALQYLREEALEV
ncbi:hypothetical protein TALC_01131 [Thermoplasmatales archaeon BRNA1]|nr:hypothetical protein TALC_01131 [Thermoplasmatales archaeon BRNA1]